MSSQGDAATSKKEQQKAATTAAAATNSVDPVDPTSTNSAAGVSEEVQQPNEVVQSDPEASSAVQVYRISFFSCENK